MKKVKITLMLCVAITGVSALVTGCKHMDRDNASMSSTKYTCAHHPEVVMDHPGTCPKCGMALTPKS